VFFQIGGKGASLEEIGGRAGTWFDPELVRIMQSFANDNGFWDVLGHQNITDSIFALEPQEQVIQIDDDRLDEITAAFGLVVDAKSPYTYDHSVRVAGYAQAIGEHYALDSIRLRWLRRGAFLHDLGKLGISNAILDKPDRLDDQEWGKIKQHPVYTREILHRLAPFAKLAIQAGAHHERLDGRGYPNGIAGEAIELETRIITTCDIYDALTAARPYRDAIPVERAFSIMDALVDKAIDPECLQALKSHISASTGSTPA